MVSRRSGLDITCGALRRLPKTKFLEIRRFPMKIPVKFPLIYKTKAARERSNREFESLP